MNVESVFGSEIFTWIIIPLLIFLARIADVTLGTMRIVFISKQLKYLAPLVGFFEVIIWLLAIRQIMQNLNNVACYIAYGAGFAIGTLIGIHIEYKMAIGSSIIRIITKKDATELIGHLRSKGYGVTSMDAEGSEGKVHVIYMTIRRQDFENIAQIIREFNPNAFYTMEDIQLVSKGVFPMKKHSFLIAPLRGPFKFWRKGK
ncbi:MAG: DUF2179 domain-containing protein [Candidatus Aminicenantes bacterium]|nr:MAG: DUF2179 domain-containing protein [Candidatus Aminicenantes bacterium]